MVEYIDTVENYLAKLILEEKQQRQLKYLNKRINSSYCYGIICDTCKSRGLYNKSNGAIVELLKHQGHNTTLLEIVTWF